MALLTMRFAGKFLAAQICSHAPSTRSLPLSKAKRWLATLSPRPRSHLCQPFSAYMTQTTEHVVMQPHAGNPTIYLLAQNSRVVLSVSDFFSSTKKGLVIGIPNLIPCVLNATGHRNAEDATSLLKWVLHHRNQAYKLLKSHRLRTLS